MKCLTLFGTTSIQEYIFRSNRLRENIGASRLAWQSMNAWESDPRRIYVGGGNAALIFDDPNEAEEATWRWSLDWLSRAPGLQFSAAHVEYPDESLKQHFEIAIRRLQAHENSPPFGRESGALGVIRACTSTGLAASQKRHEVWVSSEIAAKHDAVDDANEALRERYRDCLRDGDRIYDFPQKLDDLGIEEGSGQIAIIHADGNGIGDILQHAGASAATDGQFVTAVRDCSARITRLAFEAFHATLQELTPRLSAFERDRVLRIKEAGEGTRWYPVRPLVDGGDDLTFVCHGRLALHLATLYLRNFEKLSREKFPGDDGLSACAGVIILPHKFPFARGYELAEQLTASAKGARRQSGRKGSWIDYQILFEGCGPSLDDLRRTFQRFGQNLLRRPYRLGDAEADGWDAFEDLCRDFRDWPRSRSKALLQALARGREATDRLAREFGSRNWNLPVSRAWEHDNDVWRTRLFDPLEALDFYPQWPTVETEVQL